MTDWSAHAMAGVLHQVQDGKLRFIGAGGQTCKGYETNYHSSRGELAALHYAVEKLDKWLQLGPFLVLSDNTNCVHWQTMEVKGGAVWRWLDTFSRFNFRIKHVSGRSMYRQIPSPAALTCLTPLTLDFRQELSSSPGTPLTPPFPRYLGKRGLN